MTDTFRDHAYDGAAPATFTTTPAPTHAANARTLVAAHRLATLATLRPDGHPFASVVQYVTDEQGRPITLISELAEHTKNLRVDGRASVLVSATVHEGDDPMALPRVTLLGTLREVGASGLAVAHAAFVDAHPTAASYAGFGDFTFWRLDVESVRYVGGYGRMSWIPLDAYLSTDADPLAAHADAIVTHMNDDHADACLVYARFYAGFADASSARLIGVDRLGMDLVAVVPNGLQPARVNFDDEQTTPEGVRKAVVALLVRARSADAAS